MKEVKTKQNKEPVGTYISYNNNFIIFIKIGVD